MFRSEMTTCAEKGNSDGGNDVFGQLDTRCVILLGTPQSVNGMTGRNDRHWARLTTTIQRITLLQWHEAPSLPIRPPYQCELIHDSALTSRRHLMQRTALLLFLLALLSPTIGCGPDTGGRVGVSGNVTLQGEPLESGTIQFVAADGSQMSGATITAGKYEVPAIQGLNPGKYTVRVSAVEEASSVVPEAPGDSTVADATNRELIPAEFNVNSTLTTEITSGSNTYDVAIP